MFIQEPELEFVAIDRDVTTWNSNCPDSKKCDDDQAGGTVMCNTSSSESMCDDVMPSLGG